VLNWQLSKKQQGSHKVKSRSEVKSTTAKMYRQKGGGRARHGAASVVQFRGGGVVHGPVPRSHSHKLPKKIRVLGLKSALSQMAKNNNISIFNIDKISKKTSEIVKIFSKEGIKKVLIVFGKDDKKDVLNLAIRNVPLVDTINQVGLNVYDVLKKDHILFTEKGLKEFEDRLCK
jgi:large subunit ribosomal protein L4